MRAPREIAFRLRREIANLWLLARRPAVEVDVACPLGGLPDPGPVIDRLRGTEYAREIERVAAGLVGLRIAWRRDPASGIETAPVYFRRIPYLDHARAGDHKAIWEINRHQQLVVLAQAWRLGGRRELFDELVRQLASWWDDNPFQRGINWASALEVAHRALSWIWVYHLAGTDMAPAFRARFFTELYRHGLHLERNLSVYFSPNTHLLGEAVALHALGALFPEFPGARRWTETGARMVEREIERQVRPDGSHFEQSSYYHVYALDFFLLHAALSPAGARMRASLQRMGEYLEGLLGPGRAIPLIGDDDGGRVFHPYGDGTRFGRATIATGAALLGCGGWRWNTADLYDQAAWWLGASVLDRAPITGAAQSSRLYADAGLAVMSAGELQILIKAGGFGALSAGHSHSDCLSVVIRRGGEEMLIDPGTYTYVADPAARDWFRGAGAHNTVRIDGRDQSTACGPFAWRSKPDTAIRAWSATADRDAIEATVAYGGFRHLRAVIFNKPRRAYVIDQIEGGGPGEHEIEQFWHCATVVAVSDRTFDLAGGARLSLTAPATIEPGWRSPVFGQKSESPVVVARLRTTLPRRLAAAVDFSGAAVEVLEQETVQMLDALDRRFD